MKFHSNPIVTIGTLFAALLTSSCQVTIAPLRSSGRQGPPPQRQMASRQGGSQMMGRPQQGGSSCQTMGRPSSGQSNQRQVRLCPNPKCRKPLLPVNGQRPTVCAHCRIDLRKAFGSSGSSGSSGSCGRSTSSSGSSISGYRPVFASSGSSGSGSTRSAARQEVYDYRSGVRSEVQDFRADHASDPPTQSELKEFWGDVRSDGQSFRSDIRSQYGSRSGSSSSCRRPPPPRRPRC